MRWRQFSIRFILILFVVFAVGLGLLVSRANKQKQALRKIHEVGGFIPAWNTDKAGPLLVWLARTLGEDYVFTVTQVYLTESNNIELGLAELDKLPQLRKLWLSGTKVQGNDLVHLKKLRNLRSLDLGGTQVTDEALAYLAAIPRLENLNLNGSTAVSDAGIAHFANHPTLNTILLCNSQLGDPGMKTLAGLPSIVCINASGTRVTDVGVSHFANSTTLQTIYLANTSITDAAMPNFPSMQCLSKLVLQGTDITDAGLKNIGQMNSLREVFVISKNTTPGGIAKLRIALPKASVK